MKKEFTETDVRFAYMQGYNRGVDGNPNQMESYIASLTKTPDVEISDEEIEKVSNTLGDDYYASELIMWENGAKWYREQLNKL